VFERLGAENVRIVDTVTREDASSPGLKHQKKHWRIFYWGDQARITSILKDTEIDALIHKRYAEGIVVGGTSAEPP